METIFLSIALVFYLVSASLRLLPVKKHYSDWMLLLAGLCHLGLLVTRSLIAKHPPFTNIYETFLLLPFLIFLRMVLWPKRHIGIYGTIMTFISAAFLTVALILPAAIKIPKPLMPALNSMWMYIHVPSYFFAYMALMAAIVYAIMVLVKKDSDIQDAKRLDEELKIAFFFLNVGLITGAVWAYISWGKLLVLGSKRDLGPDQCAGAFICISLKNAHAQKESLDPDHYGDNGGFHILGCIVYSQWIT